MREAGSEVTTWFGKRKLEPGPYWHAVPSSGKAGRAFFNNVRLAQGELFAVSAANEAAGPNFGAMSYYGAKAREDSKETHFENVRLSSFSAAPSRIDALFLFPSLEEAAEASTRWFEAEQRVLLQAQLIRGARRHRGDARWLDIARDEALDQCARNYWEGIGTGDPLWEFVVHGGIYFPQWDQFPTEEEIEEGKLRARVEEIIGGLGA